MIFRRARAVPAAPGPRVTAGSAVYAVGDVHGRVDLLDRIHARIRADAARRAARRRVVVYLGDYVDRGPDSRAVLERLLDVPLPGFEVVRLMGNHEAMMCQFLDSVAVGPVWMMNGGRATLASYGVQPPDRITDAGTLERARESLLERIPDAHLELLAGLDLHHSEGDYVFVHAGLKPGVALDEQDPADLLWIRDPFLDSQQNFGAMVVHGHTIVDTPELRANRIAIDTGAFASGVLTCLCLEGDGRWLIQTEPE